MKEKKKITILGTEYTIEIRDPDTDYRLGCDHDGYTDSSTKEIILSDLKKAQYAPNAVTNMEPYRQRVMRHEIIHAFLEESGLSVSCDWNCEEMVDWVAGMAPRLHTAFREAGCAAIPEIIEGTIKVGADGEMTLMEAAQNIRDAKDSLLRVIRHGEGDKC